jgi:hypothetical protein
MVIVTLTLAWLLILIILCLIVVLFPGVIHF